VKKKLKTAVFVLFAIFAATQLIRPNLTNPTVIQSETIEAAMEIPTDAAAILERSCADCHTNKTKFPFYAKISPFNWFIVRHIEEGRRQMNFSVWNTYEPRRKLRKLKQICEQVSDGEMPLPSYLWVHRAARLSEKDVEILCAWTESEKNNIGQTP